MKLLILAGGSGTRLWPWSRVRQPKQVQPFSDSTTLLQQTWLRLRRQYQPGDIFVSTTKNNWSNVKAQLSELKPANLIIEPMARNTGPAIALAAKILSKSKKIEAVATVNSDHYITDPDRYLKVLRQSEKLLETYPEALILLGIKPTYPETGYGYIKLGRAVRISRPAVYKVAKFTEKPSLTKAREYLTSSSYWWNSGLFIFRPQTMLKLMNRTAPILAAAVSKLEPFQNKQGVWQVSPKSFVALPSISIDYAVVEKSTDSLVIPASFGWTDVGHWRTVYDILSKKKKANLSQGDYIGVNSNGNLVYALSGRLVATVGLDNMVIVDTPDALLVCPRERAQEVKLLVEELKKQKRYKYL